MNAVKILPVLLFTQLLLLSGCATTLTQWTDQQLSPYLAKELGQHPRFKNQSIQLVDMHGQDVQTDIDQLTTEIRDRVFNQLVQNPGVNLAWNPSIQPLQHHSRLAALSCRPQQSLRYYIGFDIKASAKQYELSVKALDIEQGRWVSGFGKTWTGQLNKAQQQALHQLQPDQFLRGLRIFPFEQQQTDLIALYLAHNLSCKLQQSASQHLLIYPNIKASNAPLVNRILKLVANNISRFQEVAISDTAAGATMTLDLQLHSIQGSLYQFWLIAKNTADNRQIAGLDTDVYVKINHLAANPIIVPAASQAIIKPFPKPQQPPKKINTENIDTQANIFNIVKTITPIGEPFCRTSTPWVMGETMVNIKAPLKQCFGFKIQLKKSAEIFILNSNPAGSYFRLFLEQNGQQQKHRFLNAYETLRFPTKHLYDLDQELDYETMHLIAINDHQVAKQLNQLLDDMPICCTTGLSIADRDWNNTLTSFFKTHQQNMDWRQIQLHP